MASLFSHALTAVALGKHFKSINDSVKFWTIAVMCSVIPDADVLAFNLGIPYEHVFGHRGFTHSISFALIFSGVVVYLFYGKINLLSKQGMKLWMFFSMATISHAILDAFTNGGLGVAFFAPFDNTRYFFPWRPIQVSPIGIDKFFSEWGWRVIKSELIWVGIPCLFLLVMPSLGKRRERKTYLR